MTVVGVWPVARLNLAKMWLLDYYEKYVKSWDQISAPIKSYQ
jgi:hypothetical protein